MAVNVGGLEAATDLPGFPTESYLDFFIATAFVQGALFAMMNAGTDLAKDVQTGFLSRLALTPMRGSALLLGQLAGVLVLALFSASLFLLVGLVAGLHIEAGVPGGVAILAFALLIGLAFGALGAMLGLRTGSGEAVQGFFPLFFVLLFLSSMALPRPLIEQDWFRTVATYNPVSYLLEAIRSLVITGWDAEALGLGVGIAGTAALVFVTGASRALRMRLTRT
jgi:ABC-2 type transport system permease protein